MMAKHQEWIYGSVRSLMASKGFGFIAATDGTQYFFHRSACEAFDDLVVGVSVRFQTEASAKGPRASIVEVQAGA